MAVLEQQVPAGTYQVDKVHSHIGFAVRHMVVSTFRGQFDDYDATLEVGEDGEPKLAGTVRVASVNVKQPDLAGHLQSPEFFDAERHPELRFQSTGFRVEDGEAIVDGELTIKGTTRPVEARGPFSYVEADISGNGRVGLELETVVDRTAFGLDWNAPLPKGGFALENDVKLSVHLELTPEG